MLKNLFLLGLLSWVSFSYAKHPVVSESMSEAHAYKVEKPQTEHEAQRSVAGSKIKKVKKFQEAAPSKNSPESSETDSEVRYWQYSE